LGEESWACHGENGAGRRWPIAQKGADVLILVKLILFLLAVYGFANAIAVLKIGQYIFGHRHCDDKDCKAPGHPREKRKFLGRIPYLGDLFYCPPCIAFWFGVAFSFYVFSPAADFTLVPWKAALTDGFAACGMIWLLHAWSMRTIEGIADI